jgi:hypothetical protein
MIYILNFIESGSGVQSWFLVTTVCVVEWVAFQLRSSPVEISTRKPCSNSYMDLPIKRKATNASFRIINRTSSRHSMRNADCTQVTVNRLLMEFRPGWQSNWSWRLRISRTLLHHVERFPLKINYLRMVPPVKIHSPNLAAVLFISPSIGRGDQTRPLHRCRERTVSSICEWYY